MISVIVDDMMKFNKTVSLLCACALALLAAVGCSIREDRSDCPCYVALHYGEFADKDTSARLQIRQGGRTVREEPLGPEELSEGSEVQVERAENTFSVITGDEHLTQRDDSVYARRGHEWGEVWSDTRTVDCGDDLRDVTFTPHKDFCTVTFLIKGLDPEKDYPYEIRVKAGCNGMRLSDRAPLEGDYVAYPRRIPGTNLFEVRLPRQIDDDQTAELLIPRDDRLYTDDDVVKTFPLGQMLLRQGYSWETNDLEDVTVVVDFAWTLVTVQVNGWGDTPYDWKI